MCLSAAEALMSISRCLLCKALTLGMGRKTINAPCMNSRVAVCSSVGVDCSVVSAGVVALCFVAVALKACVPVLSLSLQSTRRTSGTGRTRSSGRASRNGSWICWRISEALGEPSVSATRTWRQSSLLLPLLQPLLHDQSDVSMKLLLNGIWEILKIVCVFFLVAGFLFEQCSVSGAAAAYPAQSQHEVLIFFIFFPLNQAAKDQCETIQMYVWQGGQRGDLPGSRDCWQVIPA